jgi:hypothetical protein
VDTWSPITESYLRDLIYRQLKACTPEQRDWFERIRTWRSAPIVRSGAIEHVWIVAEVGNSSVYYDDVEEGFNISPLAAGGSIAVPGYEQWTLGDALYHLARILPLVQFSGPVA